MKYDKSRKINRYRLLKLRLDQCLDLNKCSINSILSVTVSHLLNSHINTYKRTRPD